MLTKHKIKVFFILAVLAAVSAYFAFQSEAATDKYWVGGCSTTSWSCEDSSSISVGAGSWGVAVSPDGNFAYVSNSNDGTVSVIDTTTRAVVGSPITVGNQPQGLAVTPDGAYVYVANGADLTVSVIDTSDNSVTDIFTGGAFHQDIAITPDGAYAYVSDGGGIFVIEISSNTVIDTITVGASPTGVAITPDGAYVYVVNNSDNTVSVIDTFDNSIVGSPIAVGTSPEDIAITPDGLYAYVPTSSDDSVSVIEISSNLVVDTIIVDDAPFSVAISTDSAYSYVSHNSGNTLSVIQTSSNTVVDTISTSGSNLGITVTPDGDYAYLTDYGNNIVSLVDLASNSIHNFTNWAASSGGTNDSAVPSVGDENIIFDANSVGDSTIVTTDSFFMNSLNMTGYTGTLTQETNTILIIAGDTFVMDAGMTYAAADSTASIEFTSTTGTSGTPTMITTGGQNFGAILISGLAGYFQLQDSLSVEVENLSTLSVTAGTFDANDQNVSASLMSLVTAGDTLTIKMGAGIWTVSGSEETVFQSSDTDLTLERGNPIQLTYAGATGTRSITTNATTEAGTFDLHISAGSDIINITTNSRINDLDFTGFSGSLFNGSGPNVRNKTIYGDFTASATMTFTSGTGVTTFAGTTGTQVITSNGVTINSPFTFNGLGGTFQLADNLSLCTTFCATSLIAGTLDLNGFTLTNNGRMDMGAGSNVRSINFNGGIYETTATTATNIWVYSGSNFTTTGTGVIKVSGSTTNVRTFAGGGASYPTLHYENTTNNGQLNITGSNTFEGLLCIAINDQTIKFAAGSTTTIAPNGWEVVGEPGFYITIGSITAGTHTLSSSSGIASSDHVSISDSIATGGAFFFAGADSIDNGGNSGWIFTEIDATFPNLAPVSITSTDANSLAQTGDTVTISFTADEAIQTPTTAIFSGGDPVAGIINTANPSGNDWEVSYVVDAGDSQGLVTFTIDYQDLIGNPGVQVDATTDATSVTIAELPVVTPVSSGPTTIYGSYVNPAYIKPTITPTTTTPATTTTVNLPFTRDLYRSMVSEDVRQLQKFLNMRGFTVASSGVGSVGNETNFFGILTEQAVIKFQRAFGITPAVGYFGPKTRAVANSLIQ